MQCALQKLQLPLDAVVRGLTHGAELETWLEATPDLSGDGIVWLSGEAGTVLTLKKKLIQRGMTREQLKIKPYWSVKGHAHRKRIQPQL